jgi:hypothetical protein
MSTQKQYKVFLSYSHEDIVFVEPIYEILTYRREDMVFLDQRCIAKGVRWEDELQSALNEAEGVMVFWCCHSARSAYVRREYQSAINQNKSVFPILIDGTALPEDLAAYQYIDVKRIFKHMDETSQLDRYTDDEQGRGIDEAYSDGGMGDAAGAGWERGENRSEKRNNCSKDFDSDSLHKALRTVTQEVADELLAKLRWRYPSE